MASSYGYLKGLSSSELAARAKQNSADWHTDVGQRSNYEAENKAIMAELDKRSGTASALDTTTGKWTTTGGTGSTTPTPIQQPQQQVSVTDSPEYQNLMSQLNQVQQQLQKKEDYSDYIKQLQEAAKAKSLAELEEAYKKNVNAIDTAKGQIAPKYTDARNQVAGQAAVSRKNWQETASALGVNSGAAGQSDIAQNIAMQNNLAQLDKSETADMAALDLQRTQAVTDYNSAIAQAQASGDYELAAALYQEKVRADEAARADQATQFQQLLARLQFEHGVSQDALQQENLEKSRQDSLTQQAWNNQFQKEQAAVSQQNQEFNKLLTLASSFAESTGDYSLFGQFGFTQDQIEAWNGAWAKQHALELQQAYAKLAGGSKTTGGSGATQATADQGTDWRAVEDWVSLYGDDAAEDYIKANYKALGYASQSIALADWRNHSREMDRAYQSLVSDLSQLRAGGATPAEINNVLTSAVNQGTISQAQKMQLQGAYAGSGR